MPSKTYNLATIGYGLSAKIFHIPFILSHPSIHLYAIVQRTPKPDDDAFKSHPEAKIYRSAEELVADPAVDAAVITTTPSTHYELCKLCLEHGKHVIVEKPFAPTSAEAGELIEIAEQKRCLLTVYQNRRWDTDFLLLSQKIKEGALGRVVEFESHFDRHRPLAPPTTWKSHAAPGNGAIYDLGTHLLDQIVFLFGLPNRITAFLGSQRSPAKDDSSEVEDSFTILLHYDERGLLATAKAGVVSAMPRQLRFWVRGTEGSFQKFNLDCQENQLKEGMKPTEPGFGKSEDEEAWDLYTMKNGKVVNEAKAETKPATYMGFYDRFAKALAGEGSVPVGAKEARDVIRLIELAGKADRTVSQLSLELARVWPL